MKAFPPPSPPRPPAVAVSPAPVPTSALTLTGPVLRFLYAGALVFIDRRDVRQLRMMRMGADDDRIIIVDAQGREYSPKLADGETAASACDRLEAWRVGA